MFDQWGMPLNKLEMALKIGSRVLPICAAVFVAAWAYDFYLEERFSDYPRFAVAATDNVVPYRWKSVTIYISPPESERLVIAHSAEAAAFAIGGIYFVLRNISRRRSR